MDARQWSRMDRPDGSGSRRAVSRDAGRSGVGHRERRGAPIEIAFLSAFGVPPALLLKAAAAAAMLGVSAEAALLGAGFPEDSFYRLLARHLGVPYLDRPLPLRLTADHRMLARRIGVAPLAPNARGLDFVLAPREAGLSLLLERVGPGLGRSGRFCILSPRCFAALIRHHDRHSLIHHASRGLGDWDPSLSAHSGLSTGQTVTGASVAGIVAIAALCGCSAMVYGLAAAAGLLFMAAGLLNLCAMAVSRPAEPEPDRPIPDNRLPIYTVVVPLHREAEIVTDLIGALDDLDYPRAKLDIKVMVENDDAATIAALERLNLPACYDVIVLPDGKPRTKPRALNYALSFARGEFLTVYDAEDRPDPRQIRDAVEAFSRRSSTVACLQAQLAVDHVSESWLTRMFGLEYAALFDVIKPGLAALGLPVPLGGTSNHFRSAILRRVGAWDAWNVTEDIDLGFRLARFGYGVETLWSTTWEEAPVTVGKWLPQRSRWLKGWMVTLGVHLRQPRRLFRELGLWSGLAVAAALSGTVLSCLFGPVFLVVAVLECWAGDLLRPATPAAVVMCTLDVLVLIVGAASVMLPVLIGLKRRRRLDLLVWTAIFPAYLAFITLAAWRALFELVKEPSGWNKTAHGIARRRGVSHRARYERPLVGLPADPQ